MTLEDLSKYVSTPPDVATLIAAHGKVLDTVTNHAMQHSAVKREARLKMHNEHTMMKHAKEGNKE